MKLMNDLKLHMMEQDERMNDFQDFDDSEEDSCSDIELIAEEKGSRVDAYIASKTNITRSAVQRLIESGDITINGKSIKAKQPIKSGDRIHIMLPPPAVTELIAQDIPIDIVYQDQDIAVINKPVGMVVHPAAGNPDGTLVNALMFHLKDLSGIGGELRPGIVHRIDKNTSGLLVIAKNDEAHNFLSAEMKTHSVSRTYIALCEGNFREESGTINAPIGRHRIDRKRMAVVADGREAITHWQVIERFSNMTLLQVKLETGRTHQIRVHMAHINHSIVGDDVYSSGKNSLGFSGQALHAEELRFKHPRTGEWMCFSAELPEIFRNALEKLRNKKQ